MQAHATTRDEVTWKTPHELFKVGFDELDFSFPSM